MKAEVSGPTSIGSRILDGDLLLRETNHRCSNDLQLVISLLGLQSRRVESEEARVALNDAAERIAVLSRARAAITQQRVPDLEWALRQVCEALEPYAQTRSILISFRVEQPPGDLPQQWITALALVANELMTNAIKHAFDEGVSGRIDVAIGRRSGGDVVITIDDDGLPYPDGKTGGGLGLGLARQLMASIGGQLIPPSGGTKMFELRVRPVNAETPV